MSRKVLVCADFDHDLWRVNRVVNGWASKGRWEVTGFPDRDEWENLKLRGIFGLNRWILGEMAGTSATLVLVGTLTAKQAHVQQALTESIKKGNGLVLVDIHNIRDQDLRIGARGADPLAGLPVAPPPGRVLRVDWVNGNGEQQLDTWLDRVATR